MIKINRQGVTLLFVVSMIVLFLLMGTAFVVVAGDFLRGARKRARIDLHQIDAEALLDRAFYDLVREPDLHEISSPLRGHSLLGDMYGYGFTATVTAATVHASQQFITLQLNFGSARSLLDDSPYQPPTVSALAGLVLSFTSGPAKGLATRIVDHQITGSGAHTLVVQPDWGDTSFDLTRAPVLVGTQVVVNGRPFSGTGAGNFDPAKRLDQPALSTTALQPYQVGRSRMEMLGSTGSGYLSRGSALQTPNSASTNESYDTFDFQNMFLAGILPNGTMLTPSFHRAELVTNYPVRTDFRAFKIGGPNNDGVSVDNDNNGSVDGIWMDIGLPGQTSSDGTFFRPLVSYTVVDLDGRANVNAHGNEYSSDRQLTEIDLLGLPISQSLHRGVGFGPPEISLVPVLGGDWTKMLFGSGGTPGRYGADAKPGEPNVRDGWSTYKLFGYPDAAVSAPVPGTVAGDFGTAMDVHGRFAIGIPNDIRDVADPDFPIGLPVANVSTSGLSSEVLDSAYEMSFAGGSMAGPDGRGFDTPFTPQELEGVLRRADPDSNLLADRLWNLGSGVFSGANSAVHSITTASFEVPATVESLSIKLADILAANGVALAKIPNQIELLLPSEVRRGLPMNVNRTFGDGVDNNSNQIVDEIGEVNQVTHPSGATFDFGSPQARADFARHLYLITLLSTERLDQNGDGQINSSDWYDFNDDGVKNNQDRLDFRKLIAQWAINVVEFRDRDAIMTPFEVDLNPWDGWDVDGDITSNENALGPLRQVVWGCERPELLLTETFVGHDRRSQNLQLDPTGENIADGDDDFDSHLVPAVSAFFELYNPWVMNDANQYRPVELYDASLNGLDLQKKSADGSSPVWRLLVTEQNQVDLDPDDSTRNPPIGGAPPSYETVRSVRRIYFTQPGDSVDIGPEVYFPDPSLRVDSVPPGVYAVVGSAGVKKGDEHTTYFGRRLTPTALDELPETRQISLNPASRELKIHYWNFNDNKMDVETRQAINIPIGHTDGGWERNLGVSDPLEGYFGLTDGGLNVNLTPVADGQKFTVDSPAVETDFAFDEPVDRKIGRQHYDDYLANDGLYPAYRTVHLQRLANPLIPFQQSTNPYLTIDSSSLDLLVFNGVEPTTDPKNTQPKPIRFGSFERRSAVDGAGNPAPNGQDHTKLRHRLLFKHDRHGHQTPNEADSSPIPQDLHVFNRNLVESWGSLNDAFMKADLPEPFPFAGLTWNNRPYASQLELANVPFSSTYWLTRLFDAADPNRNVYQPPVEMDSLTEAKNYTAQFPFLLNFYGDQLQNGDPSPGLHRVFDYLEVPSRFVGTESYVNPQTFAGNQQGLSFDLSAPFDTLSNYRYPGKLNINTVLDERVWNGLMQFYAVGADDPLTYTDWDRSRNGTASLKFVNPYRSPVSANWVPANALRVKPAECGLFRTDGSNSPLFDYAPATKQLFNHDDRAAYFKYDRRQRLGNLVTGRSSVFAIWITVGYFETAADGSLKDAATGGRELGIDAGDAHRNRAFYIFDRSIPVAFEPGKNHNVERAVLVRSRIE